jgi:hypothetical protein
MPPQCSQAEMDFGSSGGRKLVGAFDGGAITSNGGVVLLAMADKVTRLCKRLAVCFTDHRSAARIAHGLADLLRQRIFGQALGHEDLIDHDTLRFDPALSLTAVGRTKRGRIAGSRLEQGEATLIAPGLDELTTCPSGAAYGAYHRHFPRR